MKKGDEEMKKRRGMRRKEEIRREKIFIDIHQSLSLLRQSLLPLPIFCLSRFISVDEDSFLILHFNGRNREEGEEKKHR